MRPLSPIGRRFRLLAVILLATACGPVDAVEPTSTPEQPSSEAPSIDQSTETPGLAIVPVGGVDLYDTLNGSFIQTAHEGLIFPITASGSGWHRVLTTCGRDNWVPEGSVNVVPMALPSPLGEGFDLSQAIVVVDAGHGGRDWGAVGANGTRESHVNVAIVDLLRDRLQSSNHINWDTGEITPGSDYPAVSQVWMTRAPEGPMGGDLELALSYRAEMANRAGADVFVSVHNNTGPETTNATPGSEVYYAVSSPGSDRLASLIHEELVRSLSPLGNEWGAGRITGPKARVDPPSGDDFYGVLRRSDSPAVIVEGMYISEPAEEAILNTSEGRQAYADAVYRALARFLTSDATGSEINAPEDFSSDVGSASYDSCVTPEQPR